MKLLTLLAALLPLAASAQTFDEIATEVVASNPALAARTAEASAQAMERVAANRLEATEVGFDYKWPNHKENGAKLSFEVTQAFDWPGAYGARRKAARRAEQASRAALLSGRRALELQTRTLLCEVVGANRRIALLTGITSNLDSLHQKMHTLLENSEITELDHRKVALEEIAMKQQLADARAARAAALEQLAGIAGGRLPAGARELSEYPAAELRPLADYLAAGSPALAQAEAEADAAALDARAERMGLYPGFTLGYVMERENFGDIFQGFSIGLRLPSYSAGPAAEALRLQAEGARLHARALDAERRASIAAAHSEAETLGRLLNDYRTALGPDYPAVLRSALDAGQLTYADYFTELNFYLSAALEAASVSSRLHTLLQSLPLL